MSEKASKGRFLRPAELQNHSNKGKGKEEEKQNNGWTLSFYNSYFGGKTKKNCSTQIIYITKKQNKTIKALYIATESNGIANLNPL